MNWITWTLCLPKTIFNLSQNTSDSPSTLRYIALCCYPNVNGSVRNLSMNTSTAPIFLQFNCFRENIWVIFKVQFHFLYIFVGRVDRIRKTSHITMLSFYLFSLQSSKVLGTSWKELPSIVQCMLEGWHEQKGIPCFGGTTEIRLIVFCKRYCNDVTLAGVLLRGQPSGQGGLEALADWRLRALHVHPGK